MFKYKMIVFILLTAVIMSSQAYCKDQKIRTMTGKVDRIDIEGGVIKVKTEHGLMVAYIVTESILLRDTDPISVLEVEKGDPVIIQYTSSLGHNNIISLVDNKEE